MISKHFNKEEIKNLLTSLFYSKLYYGSEVWHLPGRSLDQNKKLKYVSANALRACDRSLTLFDNHTHIHNVSNRALPDQMMQYKHSILMFKLFKTCQPEQEFVNLNFQYNQNERIPSANFFSRSNYEQGKNILLNRIAHLNNKINKSWLNLSMDSFKVKCKELFLKTIQ